MSSPRSPGSDLVVVLPGIMGSTLKQHDRLVWAPSGGAVIGAIRTLGHSLDALTLPEGVADAHPDDGVEPVALMPDLHAIPGLWTPIKGYDVLVQRLLGVGCRPVLADPAAPPGNLLLVPYDWRLSNRYNGARLSRIVEPALHRWRSQGGPYADAQVVFVCHSMGGLIARWYIERCGGAGHTRKLITLGTPSRGTARALVQLVNGVMPAIGRLSEPLTRFSRSLPSTHQLLPEYACIERGRGLLKLTEVTVPTLNQAMVSDAAEFHRELQAAETNRPQHAQMTHPIIGTAQTTHTTAYFQQGIAVPQFTYGHEDLRGDATVALVGAVPTGVALDSNTLRRIADKHGNLQRNPAVLDEVESVLTSKPIIARGPRRSVQTQVTVPEFVTTGDSVPVDIHLPDGERHGLRVTLTGENGRTIAVRSPLPRNGFASTTFTDLPPGAYTIDVTGTAPSSPLAPISSDLLIWDTPT